MKNIVLLLGLIFLHSCGNNSDYIFYEVDNLNSQLVSEIGFDISRLKENTDSVFKIDDQYYLNLIEEMSGGQDSNSFKRAKIPFEPLGIKGYKTFNIKDSDSISQIMMQCFADNIITLHCNGQSEDYLCQQKIKWSRIMSGDIEAQLHYRFFFSGVIDLYEKEYLTQKEFHYLILYMHYLGILISNSQMQVNL